MTSESIFEGSDTLIHRALGLGQGHHLKQKSTCQRLNSRKDVNNSIPTLVSNVYRQIESNWSGRIPSQENWRLERQTTLAPNTKSPEVVLERAIAILGEKGVLEEWYNQIPVASGLVNDRVDKRAAVDLLRLRDNCVDLVELKWGSDTPAFAAFEILEYGLAYLFCRNKLDEFGYGSKALMHTNRISLQVLAPSEFYSSFDLGYIANGIREGLARLCQEQGNDLEMTFAFLSFPTGFKLPFSSGEEVLSHNEALLEAEQNRILIDALNNLQPVWE